MEVLAVLVGLIQDVISRHLDILGDGFDGVPPVAFKAERKSFRIHCPLSWDSVSPEAANDEDAAIRKEQESHMLDDAARQRRRNEDSQAARNRGEDVARALHERPAAGG